MSQAAEKVLEAAMSLSADERAEVVARLQESLGGFETPEIAAAWEAEIAERIRAIDAGEVALLTEEDVNDRLREKYGPLFD
jgi:putative addiction module component (TIGR02574 family)